MAGLGGLGFALGGFSSSFQQGQQQDSLDRIRQQQLQLQAQSLHQAQQRDVMNRMQKAGDDLIGVIDQTITQAKISPDYSEAKVGKAIDPLIQSARQAYQMAGLDPSMVTARIAAINARPPATETMKAEAAAKEPPGQAELRKAQAAKATAEAKLFTGESETGGTSPMGQGTEGQRGTKYIGSAYTPRQKAIIANQGATPEQFDFDAVMYAYGNTNVAQGYRSYHGINPVTVLRSRAAQYWMDKGMMPQEANAAMAEFAAMKHGASTAATIDARMTEALSKAENTAKIVVPLADKVDRTRFKDFNDFMVNVRKHTGNQDEIRLGIALETLATNYGASLGMGNSVVTDFKQKQAEAMLQQGWDQGQIGAAVDQILQEIKREEAGTRQGMRRFIGGMMSTMDRPLSGSQNETAQPATGGGASADPLGIR